MKTLTVSFLIFCMSSAFAMDSNTHKLGSQGQSSVTTPRTGQNMQSVKSSFGDPQVVKPAVGEPPITRWHYEQFTVYFEHDKVIHTVKHRS